jgi:hypothetical protein
VAAAVVAQRFSRLTRPEEVVNMRVDRSRFNWGVLLIVLGGVALAYHRNAVSSSVLMEAWRLWPLVLVGVGLKIVLSRTPAAFVGGLVVAVSIGIMAGSAFAVGPNIGCGASGHSGQRSASQSGSFGGNSTVEVDVQCGTANITTSTDGRWHVDTTDDSNHSPTVNSSPNWLRVQSGSADGWRWDRGADDVQISIPQDAQINMTSKLDLGDARYYLGSANLASASFTLNLGSVRIDLTGARVGNLSVSTNLGAAHITLDGSSDLTGDLSTSLGSLDVCVPSELGVRVVNSDSLSSSDFASLHMVRSGSGWQTPNYDTAAHKANLTINTSLSGLKLHNAGGCK